MSSVMMFCRLSCCICRHLLEGRLFMLLCMMNLPCLVWDMSIWCHLSLLLQLRLCSCSIYHLEDAPSKQ